MRLDLVVVAILFAVVVGALVLVLALDRQMSRMRRDFGATRLVRKR